MSAKPLKRLRHRLTRLSQVGLREHRLRAEATLRLVAARVALATIPFPRIARAMGGFVAPQQARERIGVVPPSAEKQALAREIGWAVTRAADHVPFAAVCLPQAMAARTMLQKRGVVSVMHFGTRRGAALTLDAHAWVDVGPVEVTGYPLDSDFTEIACLIA